MNKIEGLHELVIEILTPNDDAVGDGVHAKYASDIEALITDFIEKREECNKFCQGCKYLFVTTDICSRCYRNWTDQFRPLPEGVTRGNKTLPTD